MTEKSSTKIDVGAIYSTTFYWLFSMIFEYMKSYPVNKLKYKLITEKYIYRIDVIVPVVKPYLTPIFYIIVPGSMPLHN